MNRLIYILTFIFSLIISFIIAAQTDVINNDAICYLISAEVMNKQGLSAGMHACSQANWPFFSFLIAKLTALTHLSYTTVAFGLDAIFSAMSSTLFVAIISALGGTQRVLWLAMAVILLSHEFNSVRQYIVRDHGYFAFYLMSIWLLLRYIALPRFRNALMFSASLFIAALFRIEGLIFLALLPLISWFNTSVSWRERGKQFIQLNTLLFFGVTIGLLLVLLVPHLIPNEGGRLPEITNQLQHGLSIVVNQFLSMKKVLTEQILNQDSARDAGIVLSLMMVSWYLISVMSNLSWVYSLLLIYGWIKLKSPFRQSTKPVVYGYFILNIIITFIFLLERLFLSSRYLVGLSLILMLWLPFILNAIRQKVALIIIALFITLFGISGIVHFGYSKLYIREAGIWLSQNIPAKAKLYANDFQLMYYSQHYGYDIFKQLPINVGSIANQQWQQFDYVALNSNENDKEMINTITNEMRLTPVKEFINKRGDKVSIYQIPQGKKPS